MPGSWIARTCPACPSLQVQGLGRCSRRRAPVCATPDPLLSTTKRDGDENVVSGLRAPPPRPAPPPTTRIVLPLRFPSESGSKSRNVPPPDQPLGPLGPEATSVARNASASTSAKNDPQTSPRGGSSRDIGEEEGLESKFSKGAREGPQGRRAPSSVRSSGASASRSRAEEDGPARGSSKGGQEGQNARGARSSVPSRGTRPLGDTKKPSDGSPTREPRSSSQLQGRRGGRGKAMGRDSQLATPQADYRRNAGGSLVTPQTSERRNDMDASTGSLSDDGPWVGSPSGRSAGDVAKRGSPSGRTPGMQSPGGPRDVQKAQGIARRERDIFESTSWPLDEPKSPSSEKVQGLPEGGGSDIPSLPLSPAPEGKLRRQKADPRLQGTDPRPKEAKLRREPTPPQDLAGSVNPAIADEWWTALTGLPGVGDSTGPEATPLTVSKNSGSQVWEPPGIEPPTLRTERARADPGEEQEMVQAREQNAPQLSPAEFWGELARLPGEGVGGASDFRGPSQAGRAPNQQSRRSASSGPTSRDSARGPGAGTQRKQAPLSGGKDPSSDVPSRQGDRNAPRSGVKGASPEVPSRQEDRKAPQVPSKAATPGNAVTSDALKGDRTGSGKARSPRGTRRGANAEPEGGDDPRQRPMIWFVEEKWPGVGVLVEEREVPADFGGDGTVPEELTLEELEDRRGTGGDGGRSDGRTQSGAENNVATTTSEGQDGGGRLREAFEEGKFREELDLLTKMGASSTDARFILEQALHGEGLLKGFERQPRDGRALSRRDIEKVCASLIGVGVKQKDIINCLKAFPPVLLCQTGRIENEALDLRRRYDVSSVAVGKLVTHTPAVLCHERTTRTMHSMFGFLRRVTVPPNGLCEMMANCPAAFTTLDLEEATYVTRFLRQLYLDQAAIVKLLTVQPQLLVTGAAEPYSEICNTLQSLGVPEYVVQGMIAQYPLMLGKPTTTFKTVFSLFEDANIRGRELHETLVAYPQIFYRDVKDTELKLKLLKEYVEAPGRRLKASPGLFFSKSTVYRVGPRFAFIKERAPHLRDSMRLALLLKLDDKEFANCAQVDEKDYLQYRDAWVSTYGKQHDAATYAQPGNGPPAA